VFADWDWFWRQSTADGIYNAGLAVLRSGALSNERYVGSQVEIGCEWALQRHVELAGYYAHFFAGAFLEATGPSEDVDYVSFWVTFKF
jgi:hypothetical protein